MRKQFSWKKFYHSHWFFVVGLILLILLSVNLTRAQWSDRAIRREIANLQSEVDDLTKERESYEALINTLETPEFLESEARRVLGFARPGENLVVVESKNGVGGNGEDAMGNNNLSNSYKWWIYFFGEM
ncbi:MAG: hypothetical protein UX17_C0040G0002 [Parcubacteria group bacterium GW2011_GWC2_45_7]|nr:MAG: hypothetical protein UX17_C0040G0002 [Parcubacteria group bacterium GW2011_GWC2_45_7]KKU73336.1 MAG: hypothetical protein UX98_C0008G0002 [Parcubacteria group bacterium GW2011_GWA2_47_26]